jgi:hypothetical protein
MNFTAGQILEKTKANARGNERGISDRSMESPVLQAGNER